MRPEMTPELDIASYVPEVLARRAVATGGAAPRPHADRVRAVILVADVTGFTAITERLAREGPRGAERLTTLLNAYFGGMVDAIAAHGGEVVRFAGDATIAAWWIPGDSDGEEQLRGAARCATRLHDVPADRSAPDQTALRLRVGVAAGPVWCATVGGHAGRWEFVVGGAPVTEAARAAARAEPGAVVLDPSAVPTAPAAIPPPAPAPPVAVTPAAAAVLRGFVGRAVVERLAAAQGAWLAEFRRVSVLFARIDGIAYEAASPLDRLQRITAELQAVVYRYDGSVNQLLVDDKGTVLVAGWGLPGRAHEDDAARAVHAALELEPRLAELGCSAAVGVATGTVFCGDRGNARRREYGMLGDQVNLAARLMQAERGVRCDSATAAAAQGRCAFAALPPVAVKGKDAPVNAFRPSLADSTQRRASRETSFIGRARERQRLDAALAELADRRRGSVLLLEGEAGIGKSSLLGALREDARRRGVVCLSGAADALEQATAYHVWREPLRQLLGDGPPAGLADAARRRVAGDPTLVGWVPLIGAVLPYDFGATPAASRLTAKGRADALADLIVALLTPQAERAPLVLILDDGHWFDSPSWSLVQAVARRVRPLLLVLATRPLTDAPDPAWTWLVNAPGTERLPIDVMESADVLALVRDRVAVAAIAPELEQLILAKACGNPFFSEQVALALRDRGHVTVAGDRLVPAPGVAPAALHDVPATVQGVIAGRIDRMTAAQQLALKVASVVGRAFPYRLVADVYPVRQERPALQQRYDDLVAAGLTARDAPPPELSYVFRHVITQEVAYSLLTFAQRHDLHRAVARWYEAAAGDDAGPYLPLLAHHWKHADEPATAVGYLERAGEQALAQHANREAIGFLEDALALRGDGPLAIPAPRLARWRWRLGLAYLGRSDSARSRTALLASLRDLGRPLPDGTARLALSAVGQLLRQVWHRAAGPPRRAREPERHERLFQAADIHHRLTEIAYFENDLAALVCNTLHTLNLADATGDDGQLARAYGSVGVACGTTGLHPLARYYCRRAEAFARRTTDLSARAFTLLVCATYYNGTGPWDTLDRLLRDSLAMYEALGDRYRWEQTAAQLGYMAMHRGRFAEARELLERVHRSASPDGALETRFLGTAGLLATILALDGAAPELAAELARLRAVGTQPSERVLATGVLALERRHRGDLAGAAALAREVAPLVFRIPPPSFYTLVALGGAADVLLDAWDATPAREDRAREDARRAAARAIRGLRYFAALFPIGRARALWCRGRYRLLRGDPRAAARAWRASERAAVALDLRSDATRARAALSGARPSA